MVESEQSNGAKSENLLNLLGCAFGVLYFVVGSVQWLAEIAGLQLWLGIPWLLAAVISAFTAYIPIVGTIAGVWGAMTAWGWSLWSALALMGGPILLFLAVIIIAGVGDGIAGLAGWARRKA